MKITKTIKNLFNWIFLGGHSGQRLPTDLFDPPGKNIFFPIDHSKHMPHTWMNDDLKSWLAERKYRIVIHRSCGPNYFSIYDIELKFFHEEDAVAFKLTWCGQ